MVKNTVWIVSLCTVYIYLQAGSRSQLEDITQRVVIPVAKTALPVAAVASGIYAYTKVNEATARIAELDRSSIEIQAGRELFPYDGQRPYDDVEFTVRMQDFLNECAPYPSVHPYAWAYHCMLFTCELSFNEAASPSAVPRLQPGDCCIESKKAVYAHTVLGERRIACYDAWLLHGNSAIVYFEQPQVVAKERTRMQSQNSWYTAQLYAAIAVSGVYAGFVLKSHFWDKKT